MSLEAPSLFTPPASFSSPATTTTNPRIRSPSSNVPRFSGLTNNTSFETTMTTTATTTPSSSSNDISETKLPSRQSSVDNVAEEAKADGTKSSDEEPDGTIVEALRSKDRLFVLRLGELMETLLNERRSQIDIVPATSYQKLLVHRCAAYYKCRPENDPLSKGYIIYPTSDSKIPVKRLCELVPAESTSQPAFKIMRRTSKGPRNKQTSQAGSVAGDDPELSDVDPSESGSVGGRSNAIGGGRRPLTLEEREAAYNEARSRIFMDFEEKEKEKEKDMSASSSTRSLVSGSASTSGGGESSICDFDDTGSTAPTESERSVPNTRDKKGGRRGDRSGASRSQRSSARGSRAASPSFKFASLYDQAAAPSYDGSQMMGAPMPGYLPHYMYPYMPPHTAGTPGQGYMAPYPYYSPYPYQHPQPYPVSTSDPGSPVGEMYPPAQHASGHVPYVNPYLWVPPQQPPPSVTQPSPPQGPQQNSSSPPAGPTVTNAPYPPQNTPPYPSPYIPVGHPYASYPMQPYFPPQPPSQGQQPPGQYPVGPPMYPYEIPQMAGGDVSPDESRNAGNLGQSNGNGTVGRSSNRNNNGGGPRRGAPQTRHAWSYGPGVSSNGNFGQGGQGGGNGDVVGPRLSSAMRRQSGASSSGSVSTGNRTPGDEASSTASSSTSSSSRRTFTSTSTTSKHPLPARPDWAVGLKPQSSYRHHEYNGNNPRGMGSGRGGPHSQQSKSLQANDFPPLSAIAPAPRAPAAGGAWTNTSSTRSILMPGSGGPSSPGSALVQYPSVNGQPNGASNVRADEQDHAFERPPPKGNAELYNPKGTFKRSNTDKEKSDRDKEKTAGDVSPAVVGLADKIGTISLEGSGDVDDTTKLVVGSTSDSVV